MAIIKMSDVRKVYPLGKVEVEAVKCASFEIEKGDFVSIAGPSGSGKSTILNMIGLIDTPTSGTVEVDGIDVYEGKFSADITDDKKKKKNQKISVKIDNRITELRRTHLG